MSSDGQALRDLVAKDQMRDVLLRYCRSVDRMDWDTVRTCFHPDAIDEHGLYNGPIDGLIEYFKKWSGEQYMTAMHLVGNVMIEIHDNQAVTESYCVATMRMSMEKAARPEFRRLLKEKRAVRLLDETEAEAIDVTMGLRMIDRFEQRGLDKPWLIAHRVIVHEWNRLEPVDAEMKVEGLLRCGRRDQSDLIFERLNELANIST